MAEEVKKAPKPVDPNSAKYKLGKIAADAYVDAIEAKKRGEKVAWVSSNFPVEIPETMGIATVYPENQAAGIAARGQLGGIRVQVGRQELDGAAIVRVSGQNVKIQVVVITGAIKNDLHTFPFSALRASSCCGVPESFCFPAHSGSVVNILSYPTVLV